MTSIDALLEQIPMSQLARQLGVDEQTAEQATRQALPALVAGMEANAQDPNGARSLAEAVTQHDDDLLDGGVDFNQVDANDGERIVGHVFGPNRDQVVNQLGGLGGLSFGQPGGAQGLQDLLGSLLGGGSGQTGALGDLLGGLLGAGRR
jgi:hypothetical protein